MKNKNFLLLLILINAFLLSVQAQKNNSNLKSDLRNLQQDIQCAENPDKMYQRQLVLNEIAEMLNVSVPEYEKDNGYKIEVKNEKQFDFDIYDLTETSNKNFDGKSCINFINNHVYHIYPGTFEYSFSHIVILEDGKLKVFKSVNCKNRGDKIEDAIAYLQTKLPDDENKNPILENVKNYRSFGYYPRFCPMASVRCESY